MSCSTINACSFFFLFCKCPENIHKKIQIQNIFILLCQLISKVTWFPSAALFLL